MNKADIIRRLHEVADFNLLGAGTWPADSVFVCAFFEELRDMGLDEDDPDCPGNVKFTPLGREVKADLMMAFAGIWSAFEASYFLKIHGYLEDWEEDD